MSSTLIAVLACVFFGPWVGLRTLEEHWHVSRFLDLVQEESDNVHARNAAERSLRGL